MKSTKTEDKPEPEYPKLMIHKDGDLVVLMYSNGKGYVVHDDDGIMSRTSNEFYWDEWDMRCFTDYHGTITLSN